jgi:outer membrane usher protein FimD/PapC
LQDAPANLVLGAKWYLIDATGFTPNTKIDENDLTVAGGGTRNVDFTLQNSGNLWPPGTYCVEIYADGTHALSQEFRVTGDATPSNAGVEVVRQVVLAQDADPGAFTPINPTTTFKSDAPFIHATVEISDAPPNTIFRARWYPPSEDPLDFDLTTSGTRWMDFRLTPTPTGFPTGQYQVEIYVNDQLAKTVEFTVE